MARAGRTSTVDFLGVILRAPLRSACWLLRLAPAGRAACKPTPTEGFPALSRFYRGPRNHYTLTCCVGQLGCGSSQPAADDAKTTPAPPKAAPAAPQHVPSGANALERAVLSGDAAAVSDALRKGAPLDKLLLDGRSLLQVASQRDDVETARLLLARGADVNTRSSPNVLTPVEAAAAAGASATLALLLDRGAGGKDGALALAAQKGLGGAVAALLAAGADPKAVCGKDGRAALHHAAAGGNAGVVRALLRTGANPNQETSWTETYYSEEYMATPQRWGRALPQRAEPRWAVPVAL